MKQHYSKFHKITTIALPNEDLNHPKLRFLRSFPSSFTDPVWGSYNLCSSCRMVDFPHPDDPTNATHSPGLM